MYTLGLVRRQPKEIIKLKASTAKPSKTVALVEQTEKKKWVWGDSHPKKATKDVIDSLEWIVDYKDPDGKSLTRKQIEDSYRNYDQWIDDFINKEVAVQLVEENKKLLGK